MTDTPLRTRLIDGDDSAMIAGRGVYFISSDAMYDLTVAFLNSFRAHNPTIALCFIPFDDNTTAIAELSTHYDFISWGPRNYAQLCDGISHRLHGGVLGHYRKLMMWEGPFSEFIYIDVDTVVLTGLDFVFDLLQAHDFVAASANNPEGVRFVWRKEPLDFLNGEQTGYSANTGFFASRRHALRLANAAESAPLDRFGEYLQLCCMEQAFLNLLIVTSGMRYSSLLQIYRAGRPDIPLEVWGSDVRPTDDVAMLEQRLGHKALMIHWAGLRAQAIHLQTGLWKQYRNLSTNLHQIVS